MRLALWQEANWKFRKRLIFRLRFESILPGSAVMKVWSHVSNNPKSYKPAIKRLRFPDKACIFPLKDNLTGNRFLFMVSICIPFRISWTGRMHRENTNNSSKNAKCGRKIWERLEFRLGLGYLREALFKREQIRIWRLSTFGRCKKLMVVIRKPCGSLIRTLDYSLMNSTNLSKLSSSWWPPSKSSTPAGGFWSL